MNVANDVLWSPTAARVESSQLRGFAAWVRERGLATAADVAWSDVTAGEAPWVADELPFDHPLWVLFSSGTTGVPKGIVHGHGAVVLEHLKTLRLHNDLRPSDRFLVVGTTSWVVWNMLVSGLMVGCTIVLLDGNPSYPDIGRAWRAAEAESVAVLGLGAAHVHAGMRAEPSPVKGLDLSALRVVTVTGSPLSSDGYRWFYREVGEKRLASVSGGTDIAGIFLGGAPTEPVRLGRLQQPPRASPPRRGTTPAAPSWTPPASW